jgi:hypothetical protein
MPIHIGALWVDTPVGAGGATDLRYRPAHFTRASCSVKMPMICSSLYLVRFIVRPFVGSDSNSKWRKNTVAGQFAILLFVITIILT